MNNADKHIADILAKYGEPLAGNVWRVQGTAVIYHKALERIAAQAGIVYDKPEIIRAERDEAVILVSGRMGERMEWSIGEALINVNYRVSGKQAAYVYAMAEKRAKDRVILKLVGLHGFLYSEEEADEFKTGRPASTAVEVLGETGVTAKGETRGEPQARPETMGEPDPTEAELKKKIDAAKTINAVTDLMLHADTQKALAALPVAARDEVRDHAKARLMKLGWPSKKAA